MKFGTELQAHLTPEWRQQYIEYEVIDQSWIMIHPSYVLFRSYILQGLKTLLFSMLDKKQEFLEEFSENGGKYVVY